MLRSNSGKCPHRRKSRVARKRTLEDRLERTLEITKLVSEIHQAGRPVAIDVLRLLVIIASALMVIFTGSSIPYIN